MELLEYIRKRRGGKTVKVGVLMGVKTGELVHIAWSKCKMTGKNADAFDPRLGNDICRGRLFGKMEHGRPQHNVPHSIKERVNKFAVRCSKYFKVAESDIVVV